MASYHNTLRYGELDEVGDLVDANVLDEGETRAVLLNLIDRLRRLERQANRAPDMAPAGAPEHPRRGRKREGGRD